MKKKLTQQCFVAKHVMACLLCFCLCSPVSVWGLQEKNSEKTTTPNEGIHMDLSGTALLIIDIQNDYFPDGKFELTGSVAAADQAQKALTFFRSKGLPVIHIQHEYTGENPPFFAPDSDGQKIHETVLPLPGEPVFIKHLVSSFEQTPLLEYLNNSKIKRLIIAGMQTNVCVLGTLEDALKKEFDIIVLKDACAARDVSIHDQTLTVMEEKGVKVMSVDMLTGD